MRRRTSFTDRRRTQLTRRSAALEVMEERNLITESLGVLTAGVGLPAALLASVRPAEAAGQAATWGQAVKGRGRAVTPASARVADAGVTAGTGGSGSLATATASPRAAGTDWLDLNADVAEGRTAAAWTRPSAGRGATAGGGDATRGGGGGEASAPVHGTDVGEITPLRLPDPVPTGAPAPNGVRSNGASARGPIGPQAAAKAAAPQGPASPPAAPPTTDSPGAAGNPGTNPAAPTRGMVTTQDVSMNFIWIGAAGADADAYEPGTDPSQYGTFTISRSRTDLDFSAALTVPYTIAGTAQNGVDYQSLSGTVTIPAGQTKVTLDVVPIDDTLVEGDETVVVTPQSTGDYGVTGGSATVTIHDNDFANPSLPTVTITANDPNAAEANLDTGQFTVSRTGSTAAALTVQLAVSGSATNGTDYNTIATTVTIPAGQASTTITVTPKQDTLAEGDETVVLTVVASAGVYNVGNPSKATVTIADDDTDAGQVTNDNNRDPDHGQDPFAALVNPLLSPCSTCPPKITPDPFSGGLDGTPDGNGQPYCGAPRPEFVLDANPHPIITAEWNLPADVVLPGSIEAQLTLSNVTGPPASVTGPQVHFTNVGLIAGQRVRFTMQVDASALHTGYYLAFIDVTLHYGTEIRGHRIIGSTFVVNQIDSPYGNRWAMGGLDQIYDTGTFGTALVRGDGSAAWFAPDGPGQYVTPAGSTTRLTGSNTTGWVLTHPDGSRDEFSNLGLMTGRTDRNGNHTTYTYDSAHGASPTIVLGSATDPYGRVASYTYDGNRMLQSMQDYNGRTTSYGYDTFTDAQGKTHKRLVTITQSDPDGAGPQSPPVTTFTYDGHGLLTSVVDPLGNATTYTYDNFLRVASVTRPGAGTTSFYPALTQGMADLGTGQGSLVDPARMSVPADAVSRVVDATGKTTTMVADRFGYATRVIDPLGRTTVVERDANGMFTKVTAPDPDGPGGPLTAPVTTYAYDARGNLTGQTLPGGATRAWTYDPTYGQLTSYRDENGKTTTYGLDAKGNRVSETDPLGRVTTYAYDGHGQLTGVTRPDPDGPGGPLTAPVTAYAYDAWGRLTTVTYPGNVTRLYGYDAANNLVTSTDELLRVTSYGYDALGRLTRVTGPDPDGAGKADIGLYRPGAPGQWPVLLSSSGAQLSYFPGATTVGGAPTFGGPTGLPAVGDFDGDGRADLAVYQPGTTSGSTGQWFVLPSTTGVGTLYATFGGWQDLPAAGDFDGDGRTDLALYRPATGDWYVRPAATGVGALFANFGGPSDRPAVGDFDGDGKTDLAVYRASTGQWFVRPSSTGVGALYGTFGGPNDLPAVGDYDGDRQPDLAVYRPSTGEWFVRPSTTGVGVLYATFGGTGGLPAVGDYDGQVAPVTAYAYDAKGQLRTATDPLGRTTSYNYDAAGRLVQVVAPNPAGAGLVGLITTYVYDNLDRLTQVTAPDPDGTGPLTPPITAYTYDDAGQLIRVTAPDPDGAGPLAAPITTYTYDNLGRVTSVEDALHRIVTYAYDARDRLTTVTAPAAGAPLPTQALYAYDPVGRLTRATDPLNRVTTYVYDDAGQLTRVVAPDPDGAGPQSSPITTYTYDNLGRVTSVQDPLGRLTTYAYDARDRLTTVTAPAAGAPQPTRTLYAYDPVGNVVTKTDPLGRVTSYAYDALDRLVRVVAPDPDGAGPQSSPVTVYAYDPVGNLVTVTDPLLRQTHYAYDRLDRLTGVVAAPVGAAGTTPVTAYGYDNLGNRVTVADPLGKVTTYAYDYLDRVTTVTDPLGAVTTLAYDAVGNQVSVTDPLNNRTTFAYDALNRVTTVTDPRGKSTTYAYDAAGQLVDTTDRLGRRTTFAYDGLGRRTQERWLTASGGTVRTVSYSYDAVGQLTGVSDPDAALTFTYDDLGRRLTESTSGGGTGQPSLTLTSAYDSGGNRTGLTDNLASVGRTTYAYDALDRLTTITRSLGGVAGPQVVFGYDAAGRKTSLSRTINGAGTAVTTGFSYDALNRVTTITHQVGGGTVLATYAYGYDAASRLTRETVNGSSVTYTYDFAGQLTGATGARTDVYAYDSGGNRNAASGYTTTTGNRVTESPSGVFNKPFTYTYDDEGNRLSKTETATGKVTTYAYDYRNRLIGLSVSSGGPPVYQATYTYDALGRRIGVNEDADGAGSGPAVQTWTAYDGDDTYADFSVSVSNTPVLKSRYLYGPAVDEVLARTDAGGATTWYLTDRLGSVRALASAASGGVTGTIEYDGYGKVLGYTGTVDRFGYTGREYDWATGLQYNRARYYDAVIGRWTQEDPIGFGGGDANLYRYVGNGPTNAVDPSGLRGWKSPYTEAKQIADDILGFFGYELPKSDLKPIEPIEIRTPTIYDAEYMINGTLEYFGYELPEFMRLPPPKPPDPLYDNVTMGYPPIVAIVGGPVVAGRPFFGGRPSPPIGRPMTGRPSIGSRPTTTIGRPGPSGPLALPRQCPKTPPIPNPIYRGGMTRTPRLGVDVNAAPDGLIHPLNKNGKPQGLSLNIDPNNKFVQQYGGAFPVKGVPDGLQLLQSGQAGHYVVAPKSPMTFDAYKSLCEQLSLGLSNKLQ